MKVTSFGVYSKEGRLAPAAGSGAIGSQMKNDIWQMENGKSPWREEKYAVARLDSFGGDSSFHFPFSIYHFGFSI
jgi:hypothetical protein